MLFSLAPANDLQVGSFSEGPDERLIRLLAVMDKVNKRYGHDKLRLTSQQYNPE
ncbi:DUF4113 domain-containing protein [Spirosoma jeollabukense]